VATARPFYAPAEEAELFASRSDAQLRKGGALPPLTDEEREQKARNASDRRETERALAEEESGDRPKPKSRPAARRSSGRMPAPARRIAGDGAGFLLGLLAWGWIVLPYLNPGNKPDLGGVRGVKNVWRAKFLNKGPDGSELP